MLKLITWLPAVIKFAPKIFKGKVNDVEPAGVIPATEFGSEQAVLVEVQKPWWRSRTMMTFFSILVVGTVNVVLGWNFSAADMETVISAISGIATLGIAIFGLVKRAREGSA